MGVRGLVRDSLMIYVGLQLLTNPSVNELVLYGLLTILFPVWFFLERLGVLK